MTSLDIACRRALALDALPHSVALQPCIAADIRARAPGIVSRPETLDYEARTAIPGGLFDPSLFGEASLTADDLAFTRQPGDAEVTSELRFGRLALPGPLVHPLLAAFALEALAEVLGTSHAALAPVVQFDSPDERAAALATIATSPFADRLILDDLAVLPIAMRPMVELAGGRFATADINELYRGVISRRNRLVRLRELNTPSVIIDNEFRMLHEALLALFANERLADPVRGPDDRPLASLGASLSRLELAGIDLARPRKHTTAAAGALLLALGFELQPAQ